jgi:hypothetical protein
MLLRYIAENQNAMQKGIVIIIGFLLAKLVTLDKYF